MLPCDRQLPPAGIVAGSYCTTRLGAFVALPSNDEARRTVLLPERVKSMGLPPHQSDRFTSCCTIGDKSVVDGRSPVFQTPGVQDTEVPTALVLLVRLLTSLF